MSDIKAVVRIEHSDIVLTETVAHDGSATVTSVSEAGTDPQPGRVPFLTRCGGLPLSAGGVGKPATIGRP